MSDFDILRSLNQQDAPGGLAQEEVVQMLTALQQQVGTQQKQIESMRDLGARQAVESKAVEVPPPVGSVKFNSDGTVDISKLTQEQFQYFNQASDFYKQALGGFAQEANYIRAQEERARSQPWQQLATALSANLAQARDMPGWVQALGRTSAQLNPTVDQLQARRLAVMGQGAQIAEKGMALGIAQERTIEDRAQREEAKRIAAAKTAFDQENKLDDDFGKYVKDEAARAATARTFDESSVQRLKSLAKKFGRDDDRLAAAVDMVRASAEGGAAAFKEKQDEWDRQEAARNKDRLAMMNAVQAQITARAEEGREQRLSEQEVTRYERETMPSEEAQKGLRASLKALQIKGDLEERLKKVATGPMAGKAQVLNPWRPAEWQTIISLANNLYIAGIGGNLGRATERDMDIIRKMTPGPTMTREQADAAMAVMGSLNVENVTNLMATYPNRGFWSSLRPTFAQLDQKESQTTGKPSKKYQNIFDQAYKEVERTTEERFRLLFKPGEQSKTAAKRLGAVSEGRPTAINPQTKEVVEWDGKAWVPKK